MRRRLGSVRFVIGTRPQVDTISPESLKDLGKLVKYGEWESLFFVGIVFEVYFRDTEVASSTHVSRGVCASRVTCAAGDLVQLNCMLAADRRRSAIWLN